MSHCWDRGILAKSSWHGLEIVETLTPETMIERAEQTGAWPVALRSEDLFTRAGLPAHASAMIASYMSHPDRVVGVNGAKYTPADPADWRALVKAATDAGAKPSGAFSLSGGRKVLATFAIDTPDEDGSLRSYLLLVDSFDGSTSLTCGFTSIDVVCANTLAMSLGKDGKDMARIRHTKSIDERVSTLRGAIGQAMAEGRRVADTMAQAKACRLTPEGARKAFDMLFPAAAEDAPKAGQTRAERAREAARKAAAMPINRRGAAPGTLATLWNTATWLVDRTPDGEAKPTRGGADALESLVSGQRGRRVAEIHEVIEVVLRDGSIERMSPSRAIEAGCDAGSVGRATLDSMLAAL